MIKTKALYNLLRLSAKEESSNQVDQSMLEDLRLLPLESLFDRLTSFHIKLEYASFVHYANESDSPEELLELLIDEEKDSVTSDKIYLVLFELWRRLLPERPSLSIFCDELDRRIEEYHWGMQKSDEPIQNGLANLLEILEEHVDRGMSPQEAFATLSEYCANDLECFLFEIVGELLDVGNQPYARELLEEFEPYIQDPLQFEFLAARLLSFTDIQETNRRIALLLKKTLDPELLFEVLGLLVVSGDHHLFQDAVKKLLPEIKTEEEFQEVIELAADYYRRLDKDELEEFFLQLKAKRTNASPELDPKDPDLREFEELMCRT